MKTLKDYLLEIETLKYEIEGCENLIEFYTNKRAQLMNALKALEDKELQ